MLTKILLPMGDSIGIADLMALIQGIEKSKVLAPDMPMDVFINEAGQLYDTADKDRAQLTARGLPEASIDNLPTVIDLCRTAQSDWFNDRYDKQAAEQEWTEKSPTAYELRNDLIAEFEYAFKDDAQLLARLSEIRDGASHADMVQDLSDLAVMGNKHLDLLETTFFDSSLLTKADEEAKAMGILLARATGERTDTSAQKLFRDQAYTYLRQQVDAIRRTGKFVFRKDKDHVQSYQSAYYRAK
ncbi:MAG: hypothetical protein JEZ09_17915 [Salinivirgaceae bacterium]|nr:hypothetical protein [Salinivirgaceae bacterium]